MLQEDALSGLSVQWFPQPEVSSKNKSVICKLGFLCHLYGYHQQYFYSLWSYLHLIVICTLLLRALQQEQKMFLNPRR